ncbi:hypothetical protein DEU56DRAFT_463844 [Suillus clintonianus]|uniref:uncharacterized protein n=1 Tax=Suillus clintonianus TaxID=1904413 RepID=UPI001B87A5AF|nr:uncharacterized protein DEU56DRAFT_463844 [Suillus clintonianus]KAG2130910.1 hypothetical protein DEU56DRAFT_463844 [Suillus clintonianus]
MSPTKIYVCSQAKCSETFTKFTDLKKHEAGHALPENVHTCTFPGCDFTTLQKRSFDIHYARHTGEQRYVCPHDCTFRTHDPSALTRHRKAKHGYVPSVRSIRSGGRVPAPSESDRTPSSESLPASSYQSHPDAQDPSLVFYGPPANDFPFTIAEDDFIMFSEPVRTASGWTEGCMCPELMQRRPSEMMGYAYGRC